MSSKILDAFSDAGCIWAPYPQHFVSDGLLGLLSGSAIKLYMALLYTANRYQNPKLNRKHVEKLALHGLTRNSVDSARNELVKHKLVEALRTREGYEYTICLAGDPLVTPKRGRGVAVSGARKPRRRTLHDLTPEEYRQYYEHHLTERKYATDRGFKTTCPFHTDRNPSLDINVYGGVWHCFPCGKGGGVLAFEREISESSHSEAMAEIAQIAGVEELLECRVGGEPEATYSYVDADGTLLYQVLRFPAKEFLQRRPDGKGGWIYKTKGVRKELYNLAEVTVATHVIVCEGEKDADNVRNLHLFTNGGYEVAVTTNVGGAGKWLSKYTNRLLSKRVVILADNDEKGLEHAENIQKELGGAAKIINFGEAGSKEDVSDYLIAHSAEELRELIGEDWFNPQHSTESVVNEYVEA